MILTSPNTRAGPYVVGEKPDPIQYQFQDATGAPHPLVGYAVKLVYKERDGGAATTVAGTLVDGPSGIVGYTINGTEFTPGHWQAEFWAGNGVQRFCSVIITFDVRAGIGPVPAI